MWLKLDELQSRTVDLSARNSALTEELATANRNNSAMRLKLEELRELSAQNRTLTEELATANRNSYAMWLKLMELPSRAELDNQVKDLSIKLNEISHSNSFRIGRIITWPFRKCKAVAASIRGKLTRCSQLKKEYGGSYMWRCIFRKIAGKPVCHPYDVVSSIGVNCEISFNLNRVHGFVDSYPLIWAFVHSLSHLSELIEDPMSLASDQQMDHNYDHNMVRLPYIDVSFHCKGLPGDILGPDGNVDEKKAQAERDELKSRLAYLAKKWKNVLGDASKTVLCVLTPWEESSTTEEILAIYEALRKYPGTDLLVVLTGKEKKVSARRLRSKGILVRYITRHPPHDKVTDLQENDLVGWNRICHEFPPRDKKITRKVFKYEK